MNSYKVTDLKRVAALSMVVGIFGAAAASAATCAEEIPKVESEIQAMSGSADKNIALHQIGKAKERLSVGKEKSCLRYVGSARSAVEAANRHHED